ncbi:unnamed protein product, partial [Tetraodon nigroviridis]
SLWSLSRWVRCAQVTRHLTLRGFLNGAVMLSPVV